MSETECVTEFKLGDVVVTRCEFLNWVNSMGTYAIWTIEAITISANKTMYHTPGGSYTASDLVSVEDIIMLGIEHLQSRQTALIKMLKARGDSNE